MILSIIREWPFFIKSSCISKAEYPKQWQINFFSEEFFTIFSSCTSLASITRPGTQGRVSPWALAKMKRFPVQTDFSAAGAILQRREKMAGTRREPEPQAYNKSPGSSRYSPSHRSRAFMATNDYDCGNLFCQVTSKHTDHNVLTVQLRDDGQNGDGPESENQRLPLRTIASAPGFALRVTDTGCVCNHPKNPDTASGVVLHLCAQQQTGRPERQ